MREGKGLCCVVADEVRKLAEKTIEATEQIANKISSVQSESRDSIKNIDKTVKEVAEALHALNDVKNTLNKLSVSSDKVRDQVIQMATATEEQSSASEMITHSAEHSSTIASEVKKTTDTLSGEVNSMSRVVKRLSGAIEGVVV